MINNPNLDKQILNILPRHMRSMVESESMNGIHLQEIRIRINQTPSFIYGNQEYIPSKLRSYMVKEADIKEMLEYISQYSLYAYEQEIKQGFITIEGGHRIGLVGKAIVEQGKVKNMKYISSLNIRIAHEVKDCAKNILPYIYSDKKLCHTLLISPPRCGKTTLLRDMIRMISSGKEEEPGRTIGVVDERSEIGGCYHGIPQNDLGPRTDILDACPKVEGMMMLIRSMSPEMIAIDEIGTEEEVQALEYAMHSGCGILATVHGTSLDEIQSKPVFRKLIRNQVFQRYVIIRNYPRIGYIGGVYNGDGVLLYQDGRE